MNTQHPWPKSHPGRPIERWSRPLPPLTETRSEVAFFAAKNAEWAPMLRLYERLCLDVGMELYGSAVMGGGLVLSARPDVAHNEGVILVYFDPRKKRFSLSYRHWEVQPDQEEECAEGEVWERLRLFLAYKFGLHRKPEPNKALQHNDPSCHVPCLRTYRASRGRG